jgi:type II secretory pathway component GspD/PulD (secretin)
VQLVETMRNNNIMTILLLLFFVCLHTIAFASANIITQEAAAQKNNIPERPVQAFTELHPVQKNISTADEQGQEKTSAAVQGPVLYQPQGATSSSHESVSFNFEETDLKNLVLYMEQIHQVKFILPDVFVEKKTKGEGLEGHKISFRSFKNLTKTESWNLFIRFMGIASFDVVPMAQAGFYNVVSTGTRATDPQAFPTYIDVSPETLPNNDMPIRYVYYLTNADPQKVQQLVSQLGILKSGVYADLQALYMVDKAYNIKMIMEIVQELDSPIAPQMLSVIKLKSADVTDVKSLYESLSNTKEQGGAQKGWVATKGKATLEYFPQDVMMTADKRTNSLILLGSKEGIEKIEEFIKKYVDVDTDAAASPMFVYTLQYMKAASANSLLNSILQYGSSTEAGKYGGIRDGYKFLQPMTIVADDYSNSLVFNAVPQDYEMVKNLLDELDKPQKQVAVEVLFLQVQTEQLKAFGSQITGTGAQPATFFNSVSGQTSFLDGLVTKATGAVIPPPNDEWTIRTSLAQLLTGIGTTGSTILTFGQPIWAIFRILQQMTVVKIISNPFGITSNNTELALQSGEMRRVINGLVQNSSGTVTGFENMAATLNLTVTPQVNRDNIVNLDIKFNKVAFTNTIDQSSGNNAGKTLNTKATLADGEVLVLGGLLQENITTSKSAFPGLEKIPVFGWLFKNKERSSSKDYFVVFISVKVLDPAGDNQHADAYTQAKVKETQGYLDIMARLDDHGDYKDPIQKYFFGVKSPYETEMLDAYDKKEKAEELEAEQRFLSGGSLSSEYSGMSDKEVQKMYKKYKQKTEEQPQSARRKKRRLKKDVKQQQQSLKQEQAPIYTAQKSVAPVANAISSAV